VTRLRSVYVCSECGHDSTKWEGRCPACEAWNSYVEEVVREAPRIGIGSSRQGPARLARSTVSSAQAAAVSLADVDTTRLPRIDLGSGELGRVLGGGVVPGSLTLVSGDPGIGKSTLLLQLCAWLPADRWPALYVTAEESLHQLKTRADRLAVPGGSVRVMSQSDVFEIVAELERMRPAVAVIDSVQTVTDPEVGSSPGSVAQVREVAARLMSLCKETGTAAFLVGHVNKEGAIAGPRVLEHMVDAVVYLEGDRERGLRLLRAHKNRFGSTDELGVFEMTEEGLREASEPARAFFEQSSLRRPGTAVFPAIEGSRALLVEVQSLVAPTAFGLPRRSATGVDLNRLHMLLAVMERRAGAALRGPALSSQDVYVNAAGGIRLQEPGADLADVMAMASTPRERPLPDGLVVAGEVGLSGEVRDAGRLERRLGEARRLGFRSALVGERAASALSGRVEGMEVRGAADLAQAVAICFPQA